MKLVASEITVSYPGTTMPALDRVSCALESGEFVVVAGPNGSGKSTCFRALLGLQPLTHGNVTVDDTPIGTWPRDRFARRVAALPQREEPAFALSVREAVGLGRWARLGPLGRAGEADRAAAARAMALTALNPLADRSIDTLSGGEWQRVRVARALAAEPELLLLDEPGTALDLAHEMALYELLADLVRGGLGVLAITHQLNVALRFADRVVLLDRGQVVADGAPADALTPERLTQVFNWPVAVETLRDGGVHLVPLRRHEAPTIPKQPLPAEPPAP